MYLTFDRERPVLRGPRGGVTDDVEVWGQMAVLDNERLFPTLIDCREMFLESPSPSHNVVRDIAKRQAACPVPEP